MENDHKKSRILLNTDIDLITHLPFDRDHEDNVLCIDHRYWFDVDALYKFKQVSCNFKNLYTNLPFTIDQLKEIDEAFERRKEMLSKYLYKSAEDFEYAILPYLDIYKISSIEKIRWNEVYLFLNDIKPEVLVSLEHIKTYEYALNLFLPDCSRNGQLLSLIDPTPENYQQGYLRVSTGDWELSERLLKYLEVYTRLPTEFLKTNGKQFVISYTRLNIDLLKAIIHRFEPAFVTENKPYKYLYKHLLTKLPPILFCLSNRVSTKYKQTNDFSEIKGTLDTFIDYEEVKRMCLARGSYNTSFLVTQLKIFYQYDLVFMPDPVPFDAKLNQLAKMFVNRNSLRKIEFTVIDTSPSIYFIYEKNTIHMSTAEMASIWQPADSSQDATDKEAAFIKNLIPLTSSEMDKYDTRTGITEMDEKGVKKSKFITRDFVHLHGVCRRYWEHIKTEAKGSKWIQLIVSLQEKNTKASVSVFLKCKTKSGYTMIPFKVQSWEPKSFPVLENTEGLNLSDLMIYGIKQNKKKVQVKSENWTFLSKDIYDYYNYWLDATRMDRAKTIVIIKCKERT